MNASSISKNIPFINTTKTIAIFLMVLAHLAIANNLHEFINGFRMPLFFIITGYLISIDTIPFRKLLIKKVRTLLLPYYLFAFFSLLYWYCIGNKYGSETVAHDALPRYITGALLAIPDKAYMGFNFPIWFLPSLFCTEIMLFCIQKIFKHYSFLIILCLCGIGILLTEIHLFRLPFGIDISLFALLFVQIGQWLKDKDLLTRYVCRPPRWVKLLLSAVLLGMTIYICQMNLDRMTVSMVKRIFNNYFLYFIGSIAGSFSVFYLSSALFKSHLFDFFGRNTILILGLHIPILGFIKGIQVFVLRIPLSQTEHILGVDILYVVCCFIILIPVIYLVNQYVPFLIGRKKGIR